MRGKTRFCCRLIFCFSFSGSAGLFVASVNFSIFSLTSLMLKADDMNVASHMVDPELKNTARDYKYSKFSYAFVIPLSDAV